LLVKAIILFLIGFILLIKGGDWFVDGAVDIAHKFHMPELLIGATVVSIGTTLPEVMVSSQGALYGSSSIAFGNAIGSIICNTALISSITLIFAPSKVDRKTFVYPTAAFWIATLVFCIVSYTMKEFTRPIGILLLCLFVAYMVITVRQMMKNSTDAEALEAADVAEAVEDKAEEEEGKDAPLWKDIVLLVVGAAVITVGANLLVNNAQILAEAAGVPESVIALTLVALGTSLPELVTAITSLIKGHGALSLGNIIGANLFNIVLVLGAAVTIRPFTLESASASSFTVDIPLMVLVMAIMVLPALIKQKLYRWQGILMLCMYIGYCVFLFTTGGAVA